MTKSFKCTEDNAEMSEGGDGRGLSGSGESEAHPYIHNILFVYFLCCFM